MVEKSYYPKPVTPIRDLTPYFHLDPEHHTVMFIGDKLEIRIPKRFEVYNLLDVSDTVTGLGVMDLIIDEKYQCAMAILSQIKIEPSEISETLIESVPYLVLTLKHGDLFIANTQVVQNSGVVYAIWVEFITRGKVLYPLGYNAMAMIFDRVEQMTGTGIGVDRVMFELVIAHLSRSQSNLFQQYRYTDMKEPPQMIQLRSVSYAPSSTTARLAGSYFDEGLMSSLITENTHVDQFEQHLRGIPFDQEQRPADHDPTDF